MNVCEQLSPRDDWEGIKGKSHGRQPDLGSLTVRDETGGLRKREQWEGLNGHKSGNAETANPLPKVARVVFLSQPRFSEKRPYFSTIQKFQSD